MQTLHVSEISIPEDRQRQDFDAVAILELAQSIKTHGLFHAIQVRQDGRTLVSGERRLRAIQEHLVPFATPLIYNGESLPPGHVPYVVASSTDPLAVEEIELHENLVRRDLTWQEHAQAVARLKRLREAQAGTAVPTSAVAREVHGEAFNNYRHVEVGQEIIVAAHLNNPAVAAAPDLKTAFKTLKRIEDAERNRALAIAVGRTYSTSTHKIFNEGCLTWMSQPEWREKFDVILTDPPYGMGAHEFGDGAGRVAGIEHDYDDTYENWHQLMDSWCPLSYIVAKPQAHAYVFCDIDRFPELRDLMRAAGWYVFRTPLTNYKAGSGRVPLPDRGPRRQSEWLLYAIKGEKKVNMIASDVIVTEADEQLSHGAQKPVALYEDLLRRSVKPGDWVLDTFAGTGTILPAAHTYKCTAVAVEKNPVYYGLCLKRLEALSAQGELV